MIVEITLLSFFLGSSMEDAMFQKEKNLIETAKLIVIKKNNEFFFKNKNLKQNNKSKQLIRLIKRKNNYGLFKFF
jgi:hypothetical protein